MGLPGSDVVTAALARVRRPEYTGENRCWPCTVVNAALLAVVAAVLAVVGRPFVGGALFVVGAGGIGLRGYLVPGTPRFAPRLVARLPGGDRLFHGSPDAPLGTLSGAEPGEAVGEELMGTLVAADALERDGEVLYLTEPFRERWHGEMNELRAVPVGALAEAVEDLVPEADVTAGPDGEWLVVSSDRGVETTISRPVAIAEVAAVRALAGTGLDDRARRTAARPLRMFLDTCPACESELVESSTVSCCGGETSPKREPQDVLVCPTCNQRLYTFPAET